MQAGALRWQTVAAVVVLCGLTLLTQVGGGVSAGRDPGPPSVRTVRVAGPRSAVAPPAGSAMSGIDRDAGVSVRLRDGSIVWFFGDSALRNAAGQFSMFEIGSVAWAAPGAPTVPRDVLVSGRVLPLAQTGDHDPPCPPDAPIPGRWPLSAVAVRSGARDRVIVWMGNVCLGEGQRLEPRGVSVGDWFYEPGRRQRDRPIVVQVLDEQLFPDLRLGSAALVDRAGRIVVYGCGDASSKRREDVRCSAATVEPDRVADPSAYRWWDGSAADGAEVPPPMDFAAGPEGPSLPVGPFSVGRDPSTGKYLMAYSPWPGFVPDAAVRVAARPQGPWSRPHTLALPGCADARHDPEAACYGANLQTALSRNDVTILGYYDRRARDGRPGGEFFVLPVDIELDSTR